MCQPACRRFGLTLPIVSPNVSAFPFGGISSGMSISALACTSQRVWSTPSAFASGGLSGSVSISASAYTSPSVFPSVLISTYARVSCECPAVLRPRHCPVCNELFCSLPLLECQQAFRTALRSAHHLVFRHVFSSLLLLACQPVCVLASLLPTVSDGLAFTLPIVSLSISASSSCGVLASELFIASPFTLPCVSQFAEQCHSLYIASVWL